MRLVFGTLDLQLEFEESRGVWVGAPFVDRPAAYGPEV